MIGAVAGSAGAYVIDQGVQHQAAAKARLANQDNPQYNDREPQHFKERTPQQFRSEARSQQRSASVVF